MPFLDPGWQFDPTSFILGILAATILATTLLLLRAPVAALRTRIANRAGATRERLAMSGDERYLHDLNSALQNHHLAGSLIALEEVVIPPRYVLEPPPPDPNADDFEPDITYVVPVSPDYPELSALFQAPSRTLRDLARSETSLLIIGRPGSGRTTGLALLAIFATRRDSDHFPTARMPVFAHAANLDTSEKSAAQPARALARAANATFPGMSSEVPQRSLERALEDGTALILLDGWDDLPPADRESVSEWLAAFHAAYPQARIIATGPIFGYQPLLAAGLVPVVQGGWTDDDFRRLVWRWVRAWEALLAARRRRADDAVEPALVAGWLSGGTGGRLPYEITLKIWGGLAGDAEGPRPVDWFSSYLQRKGIGGEVTLGLESAAVALLKSGKRGLSRSAIVKHINAAVPYALNVSRLDPADAVDRLARPGGLLARRAGNLFAPSHPLTLGYLAARALSRKERAELLAEHYAEPYWHVALQPYAAIADATPIVSKLLNGSNGVSQAGLLTCARWLTDAPSNAGWRNEVLKRLAQLVMSPTAPAMLRGRALSALVAARDDHVSRFLQRGLTSDDPLARQFAAVGLGANRDGANVSALSELMRDGDLYVRWAAALALAIIGTLPALEALGTWLLEGDEHQRLAAGTVLALHPSEGHAMLRDAIEDQDTTVRRAAVLGLRRIGAEDWVMELLQQAFVGDPQWIVKSAAEDATQFLRAGAPRPVPPLPAAADLKWLSDWAQQHGQSAPTDTEGLRRSLVAALQDGEEPIQVAAAYYLGAMGIDEATPALRRATQSGSSEVREAAFSALARIEQAAGVEIPL